MKTPRRTTAAIYARAANAARSAASAPAPAPVGDPEPLALPAPTEPERAPERAPGPRLVPDVLGAVLENAAAAGAFTTFARAMRESGLTELPGGLGPFTLFAPTDRAFAKLPPAELADLFEHKTRLARVVTHHLVAREVKAPKGDTPTQVRSVDGGELTVTLTDGVYRTNGARVVKPHIHATNGTVRGIDTVLMPS